ncbi:MAG: site-specific DNA-methyltransferase [Bacteroidales bacterium]|nr:site-specific DNA-methyltransferase [Bacteroidales bacterium]
MSTNYYNAFVAKLKEIFMMDHAELDFGIYRIMNQKRHDIMQFLEHDLLPQVKKVLEGDGANDTASIIARMKEIEQQAASFGASADANPEYQQLKQKLESAADTAALQNDVFSHLVTFFSRYYDNGDFVSKRRYKDNTYAIPYNGEEVKLHWANADQYYIKSSEYFRDYSFVLPASRRKVHFVLKDASTEQNNNKAANNMERRFALCAEEGQPFLEVNDDGLNIYFTYELMPKATKQDALLAEALAVIRPAVPEAFAELLTTKAPTAKDANRTLLEKHLTDYTAKNSFDYFIHKDLGGFLRRELDFYIKNEVMHLDDLDAAHIGAQLTIIKAIKQVGEKIILMLAQLEDFQKRLWLKKKFVVQCDYCITLDRVPETLYGEICANDRQREEWVRLFAIDEIKGDLVNVGYSDPLTEEFLKQNPFLVLDTAFFPAAFKHKLIASMENIDEQCNGLLINSENFQALELLQEKYYNAVTCIYADPPYNTSASEIMYKNNYKDSSWLSLMESRLELGNSLLNNNGIQCTTIDDVEQSKLNILLEEVFGARPEVVTIRIKPSGRPIPNGFAISHEYGLFSKKNENISIKRLSRDERLQARYRERDDEGPFFWEMLRKAGSNSHRENRPTMFYPLFWNQEENKLRLPSMKYNEEIQAYDVFEEPKENEIIAYPIKDDGTEGCWYFGIENIVYHVDKLKAEKKDGVIYVYYRRRPNDGVQPLTTWDDSKYSATEHGTDLLKRMGIPFEYPKSIHAVEDCLRVSGCHSDAIVIDYFGGSGTTSHAIMNLNKEDGESGKRKYILIDMAEYFDKAMRTRTQRASYSPDWRDGKPISRNGISQCFKYIRLEQYEDTLNNLEVKQRQTAISTNEGFRESYMLSYMLDTETKDSLLNLKMFENPFAMTLKTTKDNELVETPVDMVETFNYLIGLEVETEGWYRDGNICVVIGRTHRDKLRTLVIWRNCKAIGNEALNEFFRHMDFRTRDSEFDVIYVNGDNTLPNLRRDDENWKVVLTEEEFAKRMFEKE